ncbi:hypothetical protein AB0F44_11140 [Nocardioides sp. NPDC023903]|uniref:hypothetical protein n=1 Tax=Nocardioides sp. NPDC023903 TaxID=3157195 RepID=UPI003405488C
MKILVVGTGGREHALALKLSQDLVVAGPLCTACVSGSGWRSGSSRRAGRP